MNNSDQLSGTATFPTWIARMLLFAILSLFQLVPSFAQTPYIVKGTVTDDKGEPLAGAVIAVQGAKKNVVKGSATTDVDGKYQISCLETDVLEFHYIGFADKTEKVNKRKIIDISMLPDASLALDEAVVIGYGSVKKADLTGSVTNVKMADIKDSPVATVDQALQGRVAGADFLSTTGEPGAETSIRIRGSRSISASNEPLIVVDGIMDAIHDLNDINSADIESISVLKDASSTAIYGSRGSNGVIIITTKAGVQTGSKPNITFKADVGFSQLPSQLDIMNGTEFAMFRNDYASYSTSDTAFDGISYTTPVSQQFYKDPFSYGEGTNWIKEVTRIAPYQNYSLSLSGGNKVTTYYASMNYNDTEGILKKSGMQKMQGRFSIDHQLFKWLKVGYKVNYSYRHNNENLVSIGGTSYYSSAMYLSPLMKPQDIENPLFYGGQRINTPTAILDLNTYYTNRHTLNQDLIGTIKFSKHLTFMSQNSYYLYERHAYRYYPSTLPTKTKGEGGDAYRSDWTEYSLSSENTLTYDNTWHKTHHFDAMAGYTAYKYRGGDFSLSGSGYMVDENLWNNMNAVQDKETYSASTSVTQTLKMSILARANYNYKQKYYLTVTGRYDGASNFASNNKWGFFPSAALKWNIKGEKFMKKFNDIDELSIKLSAGRTGNDAISAYRSLAAMTTTTNGYLFNGSQPVAYYPSRLDSPDLTWEKTTLYNAAFTGSFFNDRVSFDLESYISKTTDLLLTVQTAQQTGYTSRYANIGATTNKGIEFSLDTRNIVRKNFAWSTSFTISHNDQNVDNIGTEDFVVAYSGPGNNPYMMYGYVKNYPLNSLWGFKYAGVWHNQEEINRNAVTHAYISQTGSLSTALGAPRYIDVNHDGTLSQDDLVYLGNSDPYIYGGLQNSFRFHNFNLGVYFTYSLGGKIYNYSELYMSGSTYTNQYRYMLDAWHPTRNPNSDYPKAGVVADVNVPSDFEVHDASYLRLKTVSLGYTFNFKKHNIIRDLTMSVVGENLYLWKKYNGFDPDVSSSGDSSTLRRMDVGAYPKSRTLIFSIQVRY